MLTKYLSGIQTKLAYSLKASRTLYTLPDLPYDYNALEPYINNEIMHLHHDKHHQAYVNNLNAALEKLAHQIESNSQQPSKSTSALQIANLASQLRFNAGGHSNHSMFWKMLCPAGGPSPSGKLQELVRKNYCNLDNLIDTLCKQCIQVQGSGWGWLCLDKSTDALLIMSTANQDPLPDNILPLLGIDVWEHAYYPQYKNDRGAYVKNIFNVVNWKYAEEALTEFLNNRNKH
ncbi:hypothetical protein GJ496_006173 [Pomphorhynchus laevis]|nr:hypothetical protein GJ496_006173 [Pomphorhynchus laevis]